MHTPKTRRLWQHSLRWVRETGWSTREEDEAIAEALYTAWLLATDEEWNATRYRDRGKLGDALEEAFRPIRDERTADCLIILFLTLLEDRVRQEGVLERVRNH
jgi:hypothetical protein